MQGETRLLTYGEKAVGITFNPANDPVVQKRSEHDSSRGDEYVKSCLIRAIKILDNLYYGRRRDQICVDELEIAKMVQVEDHFRKRLSGNL